MGYSKESHAVGERGRERSLAVGCSERRWGPDTDQEVSPPVLQASGFCLSPWGPRSFLLRSPHQQVGGTLLTALLPSTLPGRARAAAGTVCSYLLAPRVMPNHTFPQPGVGTLSEEISEHELETDFVTHGANLNLMVQFWQGPEQLWLGQGLRALGIWQNRALNANQLVKYKPSNFSSVKKKEEIWKGDRRPKFRAVSDSHNNNEARLFPKHLHISLETGDRHLQGWVQRWNGAASLPWLWVFCSYKIERDSA